MRRTVPKQDMENGQDSFLDVVSNIVGILIILVVIVGGRVKSGLTTSRMQEIAEARQAQNVSEMDFDPALETDPTLKSELDALMAEAEGLKETESLVESDTDAKIDTETESDSETERLLAELKTAEDALMETTAQERRLEEEITQFQLHKKRMDAEHTLFAQEIIQVEARLRMIQAEMETQSSEKKQKEFELLQLSQESVRLERRLEELRTKIQTLVEQQAANGGPKMIEHKNTPIVRSVESDELHFILENGRVMYVPLDELIREYELKIPKMGPSLIQNGKHMEVLGPYDGFRLRTETCLRNGRVDVYWQVVAPEIETIGETVTTALTTQSKFLHHLEKLDPKKDIITFWIYPSGFSSFSTLKEELYRHGFSIASRPLPEGTPIAGSPEGQRSVAQ
ncbi:MAG: hypothetical protein Q4C70_08500 [Planctomycetia bacterium]|nr:hypothetical protein [Planctomycetia bacterium]